MRIQVRRLAVATRGWLFDPDTVRKVRWDRRRLLLRMWNDEAWFVYRNRVFIWAWRVR